MSSVEMMEELEAALKQDPLSSRIVEMWNNWNNQRSGWLAEVREIRNYVFATDTSNTVSYEGAPWKNKVTLNKICQIRDNLHANYMSALFPNDDWMKWEGFSFEDEIPAKKKAITAYMQNKLRINKFKEQVSRLIYDYIDYGVVIAEAKFKNEFKIDPTTGEKIPGYVGPTASRISPEDIVFDLTATSFESSPKITRRVMHLGDLKRLAMNDPNGWAAKAIESAMRIRDRANRTSADDFGKAAAYSVDGFGNLGDYFRSGVVELLEFEGTIYNPDEDQLLDDYRIIILDRREVIYKEPIPAWKRNGFKFFTAWRKRPDNLYGQSPLANLIGIQYRIDQLQNAKSDAWDLNVTPMFKIIGNVDEFTFRPGGEVHIDEGGDVQPLAVPSQALNATLEIEFLMNLMEELAGAPKQAMGIRTPGEKTAFEVQTLENAAGRIFQEKIVQFETELLEPLLNGMLELARRNMDGADIVRVMDDDVGVADFLSVTKEDITAKGKLYPVGARHFSQRANTLQNLVGAANSNLWPKIERHVSDKALAKMFEDILQLERYSLVSDNIALFEQAETQQLAARLQESVMANSMTPVSPAEEVPVQ